MEVKTHSIIFGDITHVIINTGYVPHLSMLLQCESILSEKLIDEGHITCIYAYETNWHSGLLVPNPFGFHPCPYLLPTDLTNPDQYVQQVKTINSQIMENMTAHPFYEDSKRAFDRSLKMSDDIYREQKFGGPRFDVYQDLYSSLSEWSLVPINPEKEIDHLSYTETMEHLDDRLYSIHECDEQETDQALDDHTMMSYNERLKEAIDLINLQGGAQKARGTLCFKLECSIDPFDLMKTINKDRNLQYCATFGMAELQQIEAGSYNILVITYDAEHG